MPVSQQTVSSFEAMVGSLRDAIAKFPDQRKGKNTQYQIMDAAAGAFSVFFTQAPSFLAYQQLLQKRYGLSNAKTLFGMSQIPSDNQIRNLLDPVNPELLDPVFDSALKVLKNNQALDQFRMDVGEQREKQLLVALDGTEYFSSENISCQNCSLKQHKSGIKTNSHQVITPTIVAPGISQVISLSPEFITPQDGDQKQDCENKAAKRWLKKHGQELSILNTTVLGDDLYAHQPICRQLSDQGLNFILVCKAESHKYLYEYLTGITEEKVVESWEGGKKQKITYNFVNNVPVKDGEDVLDINWCEVTIETAGKARVYHNAFITNIELTGENVADIIKCGRARWKVENENNNTLKNQGYHLEHNFGHGKSYLAQLLATLNILAFLFHTLLELINPAYKLLRKEAGARVRLFNDIRTMLQLFCFKSFNNLLEFMLEGRRKPHSIEDIIMPI